MTLEEVHTITDTEGTVYGPDLLPFAQPTAPDGSTVPAPPPPAADQEEIRNRTAELTRQLISAVRSYSANRPRSQQTRLGPSEIGTPCLRQLGYKVAGQPRVNHGGGDPWPSFVGTATHDSLDRVFRGQEGWATEQRVVVDPDVLPYPLAGSTDLLRLTGGVTVIDHKVVGAETMRKAKADGPAGYYRTQINSYAHGWLAAGVPVEWVAIAYWPRSGRLSGLHVWMERYDQTVVDSALARISVVRQLHGVLGSALFGHLGTAAHYCDSCPFYRAGSTDPAQACGGHDAVTRGFAP